MSFMAKEIVINAEKEQTRIAILDKQELVELFIENPDYTRTLGDIYLARIRKIMPSIQAAFVDIGQKQDAFLHFSDLSDNLAELLEFLKYDQPDVGKVMVHRDPHKQRGNRKHPSRHQGASREISETEDSKVHDEKRHSVVHDVQTRGQRRSAQRRSQRKTVESETKKAKFQESTKMQEVVDVRLETLLKRDDRLLVKIVKEPISNKGSRVSTDISLAGRFLVLVPLADYVAVSKKIYSYKERRRLRALAKSLLPDGFGVIVRTVAEGKDARTLDTDLRLLLDKWRKMEKKLLGKPEPPLEIHQDVNMVSSVIRDLFSEDYDRILIDEPRLFRNVKNYVQAVAPQMAPAVHLYRGKRHVFEAAKIQHKVDEAFSDRVNLPTGGYLFIEHTEAMHVIDVNSGRSGRGMTQEENSLKVNLESARIIAKQIRLRDLGGIIVVDFIDLREERNKKKVYDELKKEFRRDRAVSKILPMSDFGLVQITRQRLRPSITTTFTSPGVPTTNGANREAGTYYKERTRPKERIPAWTPAEMLKSIEEWIVDYKTRGKRQGITLKVHPFAAAYLNQKLLSYPKRWYLKHFVHIRLEVDESLAPTTYRILDSSTRRDITSGVSQEKKK